MQEVSRRECTKLGWAAGVLLCLVGFPLAAQTVPDGSVAAALRSLHARAGVAFVGEVAAVRRLGGVVEVEFAVEEPVKGELGTNYVLREWGGLWGAGQRRYWVGERALVFLQAPGPTGFSSPVDGMDGVLPVSLVAGAPGVSGTARAEVDVQRLRTRVVRVAGAPMTDASVHVTVDSLPEMLRDPAKKRPVILPPNRVLKPLGPQRLLPPGGVEVKYETE